MASRQSDAEKGDGAERMADAAERAARRVREKRDDPSPSFASRLGQIGILGWTFLTPILVGTFVGRLLDRYFQSGVFITAPIIMAGAVLGFWSAWKWMHRR
ncbi:MAG: F0F1 ATP synthase subunit [Shinella sp.]|nr:MAG: F0F1 ATP synthase subunit [Shinella sp.]